jgi:hypothetical protein
MRFEADRLKTELQLDETASKGEIQAIDFAGLRSGRLINSEIVLAAFRGQRTYNETRSLDAPRYCKEHFP